MRLGDLKDDPSHHVNGVRVVTLRFKEPPDRGVLRLFRSRPIVVFDRLDRRTYYARVDEGTDVETSLVAMGLWGSVVVAVHVPTVDNKIVPALRRATVAPFVEGNRPSERLAAVVFHRGATSSRAVPSIAACGVQPEPFQRPRVWRVSADLEKLRCIARDPLVHEIRLLPPPPERFMATARDVAGIDELHGRVEMSAPPEFAGIDGSDSKVAVFDCPPTHRLEEFSETRTSHTDLLEYPHADAAMSASRVTSMTTIDVVACCAATDSTVTGDRTCCSIDPDGTIKGASGESAACSGSSPDYDQHGDWVVGVLAGNGQRSFEQPWGELGPVYALRGVLPRGRVGVYTPNLSTDEHLRDSTRAYPISNFSMSTDVVLHGVASDMLDGATLGFPGYDGDDEAGRPQVVVAAAGNYGVKTEVTESCDAGEQNCCQMAIGYFSVFSPSKNAIVVGAAHSEGVPLAEAKARESSMGPTPDGRLKPDLVAPVCHKYSGGDWGPDVLDTPADHYTTNYDCGTSFAAPLVAGTVGLLMEARARVCSIAENAARCGENPASPLLPSTYKAALVQGAADMQSPAEACEATEAVDWGLERSDDPIYCAGPDYATGFGMLQADVSRDVIESFRFAEGEIQFGEDENTATDVIEIPIPEAVADGARALRAVLAWDDPPYGHSIEGELVHDLDLDLVGPDGTVHAAWVPPQVEWRPCTIISASGTCGDGTQRVDDPGLSLSWQRCCASAHAFTCPDTYEGVDFVRNEGTPPAARRCMLVPAPTDPADAGLPATDPVWVDVDSGASIESEADCRDSRNNVERVDIENPIEGNWTMRVSFRTAPSIESKQSFSVAWGVEEPTSRDFADSTCRRMRVFADWFRDLGVTVPGRAGCYYEPVRSLCDRFPRSPVCAITCGPESCPELKIPLRKWPAGAKVSVYSESGRRVARASRVGRGPLTIRMTPERGERHILVIDVPRSRGGREARTMVPLTERGRRSPWRGWVATRSKLESR